MNDILTTWAMAAALVVETDTEEEAAAAAVAAIDHMVSILQTSIFID